MISVIYHRNFKKSFKKLRSSGKEAFEERVSIFLQNPTDPILNNHALHGKYVGCRSINITGDLRLIFEILSENVISFIAVDTHSKLYS